MQADNEQRTATGPRGCDERVHYWHVCAPADSSRAICPERNDDRGVTDHLILLHIQGRSAKPSILRVGALSRPVAERLCSSVARVEQRAHGTLESLEAAGSAELAGRKPGAVEVEAQRERGTGNILQRRGQAVRGATALARWRGEDDAEQQHLR